MALVHRSPTRDLISLRDMMDRFFEEPFTRTGFPELRALTGGNVPLDIYEEGDNVMVEASIPGINPEDLHVEVQDDQLHIWGEVKSDSERKDDDYYMRERRYGRIERSAILPHPVKADKASAEVDNGTLVLTLPRDAEARRREIKIRSRK